MPLVIYKSTLHGLEVPISERILFKQQSFNMGLKLCNHLPVAMCKSIKIFKSKGKIKT